MDPPKSFDSNISKSFESENELDKENNSINIVEKKNSFNAPPPIKVDEEQIVILNNALNVESPEAQANVDLVQGQEAQNNNLILNNTIIGQNEILTQQLNSNLVENVHQAANSNIIDVNRNSQYFLNIIQPLQIDTGIVVLNDIFQPEQINIEIANLNQNTHNQQVNRHIVESNNIIVKKNEKISKNCCYCEKEECPREKIGLIIIIVTSLIICLAIGLGVGFNWTYVFIQINYDLRNPEGFKEISISRATVILHKINEYFNNPKYEVCLLDGKLWGPFYENKIEKNYNMNLCATKLLMK